MDQSHVIYVDDEHNDIHEYDDNTGDGHDTNKYSYGHNSDDNTVMTMGILVIGVIFSSNTIIIMIGKLLTISLRSINLIHGYSVSGLSSIYLLITMVPPL